MKNNSVIAAAATGAVSLAAWFYLVAARGRFWRVRDEGRTEVEGPACSVAVVIPARNESAHIADAVRSLATQDYNGPLTIIVVDDESSDGTAGIARSAGAEVVHARALPAGWTGKMWAVAEGVERATAVRSDYVLLTDADVVHGPASVRGLVARAEAGHLDLASYMVLLNVCTAAERLLIPAFVFFFLKLYPPAWIRDPRNRTAGAAGGCILIRRGALERIGGIAAIRGELIDDCALARHVKQSGGRIWMGLTRSTHSSREYGSIREIWNMVARTAFTQLNYSALQLAGTAFGMALLYVAPVALLASRSRAGSAHGSGRVGSHVRRVRSDAAFLPRAAILRSIAACYRCDLYHGDDRLCRSLLDWTRRYVERTRASHRRAPAVDCFGRRRAPACE